MGPETCDQDAPVISASGMPSGVAGIESARCSSLGAGPLDAPPEKPFLFGYLKGMWDPKGKEVVKRAL